jgi:hypothetical protein
MSVSAIDKFKTNYGSKIVKGKESKQVQTELDKFKVIGGRERCIVPRKLFTFFRSWVWNPQFVRLYYAARGHLSIGIVVCAGPSKIQA